LRCSLQILETIVSAVLNPYTSLTFSVKFMILGEMWCHNDKKEKEEEYDNDESDHGIL